MFKAGRGERLKHGSFGFYRESEGRVNYRWREVQLGVHLTRINTALFFNYTKFLSPSGIKALARLLCFCIIEEDMKGKRASRVRGKKAIREYLTG